MDWSTTDTSGNRMLGSTFSGTANGDLNGTYPAPSIDASVALTGTPVLSNVNIATSGVAKLATVALGAGKVPKSSNGSGTILGSYSGRDAGLMRSTTSLLAWCCPAYEATGTAVSMADQTLYLFGTYLDTASTITGVKWISSTTGNYTANNNNRIGLYTSNGSTVTLVASCANDATLWTATANTTGTKAFTAPYAATPGMYYIAFLYCRSAFVTQPTFYRCTPSVTTNFAASASDALTLSPNAALTDLPSSYSLSSTTKTAARPVAGIY